MDKLLSSEKLLERLGKEEQQLKFLGLHGHAAGIRAAITLLLRMTEEGPEAAPSLEPSSE